MSDVAELNLLAPWSGRVRGGVPDIPLKELEGWTAPAGAPVRLLDEGEPIGFGLPDPANRVLRVLPAEAHEEFGPDLLRRRLERAVALRYRLGLAEDGVAYRLVHEAGDGLPGFWIDVYGPFALVQAFSDDLREVGRDLARALAEVIRLDGILLKVRPPGDTPSGQVPYEVVVGVEPPKALTVTDLGVSYEVHLTGGLNTGLFLDTRDVREVFAAFCDSSRVLNLFSYTGSFSVVAALSDAESVTSVDFAKGTLEWSKANFALNDLKPDAAAHKFVRADVFDWLKEDRRKGGRYDLILIDPPTSTNVPGKRWFLKTDYDRLIALALRVAAPGAVVVVVASSRQSRPDKLESQIRAAARDRGRRLSLLQSVGLPADFPTPMIHAPSRYLKCYVLQADDTEPT